MVRAMQGRRAESKAGPAVYVRFPTDAVGELDEWVEELRGSVPGGSGISRSDLIRDVVLAALAERREKRAKPATVSSELARPKRAPKAARDEARKTKR